MMNSTIVKQSRWLLLAVMTLALLAGAVALTTSQARAGHPGGSPPQCSGVGVGIFVDVFEDAAGTIPADAVEVGDTIFYQVTLFTPGSPNCDFGDPGTLTITTPDDNATAFAVPLVTQASPFSSPLVPYEVRAEDLGSLDGADDDEIRATAAFSGTSHRRTGAQNVTASVDIDTPVVDAAIQINPPTDANEVGDEHTLTITVTVTGGVVGAGAQATASIGSGPGSFVGSPTCDLAPTGGSTASCDVVITSTETGTTVVSASSDIPVEVDADGFAFTKVLSRETDGSTTGTGLQNSEPAEKVWVDAAIKINPPTDANEVGDEHTLTISVTVAGGVVGDGAQATASIGSGPGSFVGSPTCDLAPTGGNTASCDVVITSDATGATVVSASSDIPVEVNGTIVTVSRSTDGSTTDTGLQNSGPAEKAWVDAAIEINPPAAENFIHDEHTLTITVHVVGGTVGDGAQAAASIDSGPGSFVGSDTCDLTPTGGDTASCDVVITSDATGTTVVSASSDIPVEVNGTIVTVSRTTDGSTTPGGLQNSDPASKDWIAGSVTLIKTFEEGPFTAVGEVCFTLSRDPGAPPPISSDPLEQCDTGTDLTFEWGGLVAGEHTITETTVPDGFAPIDPIVFTVDKNNRVFVFERVNEQAPGELEILKLNEDGSRWAGPDVTFYICEGSVASCDVGTAIETVVIPADGNPAAVVLEEGTYTVCEEVPDGFTVSPSECQVVEVVSGATATVTFTNIPERDFEGCTPGFWRQPHHFDHWTAPFTPETLFSDVFGRTIEVRQGGRNTVEDPTLLEAVTATGGGINALARHAVAALLNAASPDVNYKFTEAEVIQMVQDAIDSGDPAVIEEVKDILEAANEAGCPLS